MRAYKVGFLMAFSVIVATRVTAQEMPATPVKSGDTWTYRQTVEAPGKPTSITTPYFNVAYRTKQNKLWVMVTDGSKEVGPNTVFQYSHLIDLDVCVLDVIAGKTLGIEHSCMTSLPSGKVWNFDQVDTVARTQEQYKVLDSEEIQVPAGRYQAIKIDDTRVVADVAYPNMPGTIKRYHTVYWYAPETKAMAKVVREIFDQTGAVSMRITEELTAFTMK